ncbi:hypothetical protein [Streptomyces sp. NPDC052114]|uniref:glycine-rich domain-containing protein n=1 Tax=unclassified Streptomyces TaxID=2593676 RepID=UPI00342AA13F
MPVIHEALAQRERRDPRGLVPAEEFAAVVATVQENNPGMEQEVAGRITAEALKFVAACARFTGEGLRPSRVVDEGWHGLILHTAPYTRLCRRLGSFVHHRPERRDPSRHNAAELERTMSRILDAGFTVDEELWLAPTRETIPVAANCAHGPEPQCASCFDGGPN